MSFSILYFCPLSLHHLSHSHLERREAVYPSHIRRENICRGREERRRVTPHTLSLSYLSSLPEERGKSPCLSLHVSPVASKQKQEKRLTLSHTSSLALPLREERRRRERKALLLPLSPSRGEGKLASLFFSSSRERLPFFERRGEASEREERERKRVSPLAYSHASICLFPYPLFLSALSLTLPRRRRPYIFRESECTSFFVFVTHSFCYVCDSACISFTPVSPFFACLSLLILHSHSHFMSLSFLSCLSLFFLFMCRRK